MFKHSVVYHDFNGQPHNEDLYFHMSVPDYADLEYNPTFGEESLSQWFRGNMSSGNNRKVYVVFKLLVANSYGRRSEDGSKFTRKAAWTEEFLDGSPQWEQFFLWLTETEDGTNAQLFWDGIFPEYLRKRMDEAEKNGTSDEKASVVPLKKDLKDMTREELEAAFRAKAGASVIEGSAV